MALIIYPKSKQADGEFNGGEIKEKKPIGFPQDNGELQPYSNIFYWAHGWAEKDSIIAEHPHKGFEIITYVIQGQIEHFDNKYKIWRKLVAGDLQIIKAGNGITHTESMTQNTHFFQIWFDPDISKSINSDAEYKNYPSDKFPIDIDNNFSTIIFKGDKAPLKMSSEGLTIKEISIGEGEHQLDLNKDKIYSCFLIEGILNIQNKMLNKGDFFIIKNQKNEIITGINNSRIFIVETPLKLSYKSYAEAQGNKTSGN
ncbi:pirin family protein [Bacteroidota bacterium]